MMDLKYTVERAALIINTSDADKNLRVINQLYVLAGVSTVLIFALTGVDIYYVFKDDSAYLQASLVANYWSVLILFLILNVLMVCAYT